MYEEQEEILEEDGLNTISLSEEYFFDCPHCWEKISVILDLSVQAQSYIEDCEVCCNPIGISYRCEEGIVTEFEIKSIEQ